MAGLFSKWFGIAAENTQGPEEEAPRATVSLFDLGKNGTTEAVAAEMEKFAGMYGGAPDVFIKGAIEAFHDGKPQNLQTIIDGNATWQNYASSIVNAIKLGLTAEEIKVAVSTMPAQKQQDILDCSVTYCVSKSFLKNDEMLILQTLVDAGAKVNAKDNYSLQEAARGGRAEAADFIVKNGGDYEDAIKGAQKFNDKQAVAALLTLQMRLENGVLKVENEALKIENTGLKKQVTPGGPPYTT
jgi:hypothetical protein